MCVFLWAFDVYFVPVSFLLSCFVRFSFPVKTILVFGGHAREREQAKNFFSMTNIDELWSGWIICATICETCTGLVS